jgi:hypothetical protein
VLRCRVMAQMVSARSSTVLVCFRGWTGSDSGVGARRSFRQWLGVNRRRRTFFPPARYVLQPEANFRLQATVRDVPCRHRELAPDWPSNRSPVLTLRQSRQRSGSVLRLPITPFSICQSATSRSRSASVLATGSGSGSYILGAYWSPCSIERVFASIVVRIGQGPA